MEELKKEIDKILISLEKMISENEENEKIERLWEKLNELLKQYLSKS